MNRSTVKLSTLQQVRELVQSDIDKVGPVMDDYDGGQIAAYERVLDNIRVFEAIIDATDGQPKRIYQEDPGLDC